TWPMPGSTRASAMASVTGAGRLGSVLAGPAPRAMGPGRALRRIARDQPLGVLSAALVLALVVAAVLAPALAPYDPFALHRLNVFSPPGGAFPLGTDDLGRDVLSRLLYGARISLIVGVAAVALGNSAGGLIGLVSGYAGQRV